MKKLSIIVPVYNEINTLEIIIKKLVNLKLYKDVIKEVIIIDDFSTDGSAEVIKQYGDSFDFIKTYFKKVNKGKGDSQKIAKQSWISGPKFFLDDTKISKKIKKKLTS